MSYAHPNHVAKQDSKFQTKFQLKIDHTSLLN